MNQYKELKDSFLLLKAQINALCASNSSSNEENYHELRRAADDFEAFLFHRFVDFEKIKIPKCRCRRFSPTARGRSVPCGAFLPSPGVLRRGHDIHEPTRSSCYENVGENTDDWRTPQDI